VATPCVPDPEIGCRGAGPQSSLVLQNAKGASWSSLWVLPMLCTTVPLRPYKTQDMGLESMHGEEYWLQSCFMQ